jgi:purine nucleoside phosphorylase
VVPLSVAVLHTTAGQQVSLEKLSIVSNIGSKADNLLRPYHHLRMMEEHHQHHQHHQQRRASQACLPKVVGCSHVVTTRAVGWPVGSTAVSAG